ncbi:MAG: alpha/beta fold hydrolase [Burkholderiales bacterium]|nr:alpha/beta fold hydrolase [Burkholderiales bacterium]
MGVVAASLRLAPAALAAAALLYAALLLLAWWGQERLLFQPVRLAADHDFALPADVHETWVDVPGARLHALHLRLPHPEGIVFYLHGNAGNLEGWFAGADFFRRANFDLYMIDYRGYGKSSGRIESQAQLDADVRAAWDAVAPQYPRETGLRRVVFGRSLGTALAARLAAAVAPDLTVLVSPYTSMAEMQRLHYPWIPAALLRYPLRTDAAITGVRGPLLLLHGERDELIPAAQAERLHALAPRSELVLVPGAGHNDIQAFPAYLEALGAALARR